MSAPHDLALAGNAVSSSDPIATRAAMEILAQGGNAFDAALCASMVLAVTLPMSCGIGGDGIFLIRDATSGHCDCIHAIGVAPADIEPIREFMRAGSAGGGRAHPPKVGVLTASLPALPWGWSSLAQRCCLPLAKISAAAVSLARQGFVPDRKFRRWTKANFHVFDGDAYLRDLFSPFADPDVAVADRLLQQHPLADFIDLFAHTALDARPAWVSAFVTEAVRANRERGGVFTGDDFSHSVLCTVGAPLGMRIGACDVLTSGATSQGYMALLAARLHHDLGVGAANDSDTAMADGLVLAAKIFHVIYADRRRNFGDNDQDAWLAAKLSDAGLAELVGQIERLDLRKASHGDPILADGDTTYFYVVDRHGHSASCIQSLSLGFGSGVSAPGLGMIFNSRLTRGMAVEEDAPNRLLPRRRPVNTIFPVMGLRDGHLSFIGGTTGGDIQVQINARAIHMLVTHGSLTPWLTQPRWKYSPVADVFDQGNGKVPTITVESAPDAPLRRCLQSSGLQLLVQKDVGGSAKYAYATEHGHAVAFDEDRDGGLTITPEEPSPAYRDET